MAMDANANRTCAVHSTRYETYANMSTYSCTNKTDAHTPNMLTDPA